MWNWIDSFVAEALISLTIPTASHREKWFKTLILGFKLIFFFFFGWLDFSNFMRFSMFKDDERKRFQFSNMGSGTPRIFCTHGCPSSGVPSGGFTWVVLISNFQISYLSLSRMVLFMKKKKIPWKFHPPGLKKGGASEEMKIHKCKYISTILLYIINTASKGLSPFLRKFIDALLCPFKLFLWHSSGFACQ